MNSSIPKQSEYTDFRRGIHRLAHSIICIDSQLIPAYISTVLRPRVRAISFDVTFRPMRSIKLNVRLLVAVQALSLSLALALPDSLQVLLTRAPGYGPFSPVIRLSYPGENAGPWERAVREVRGIPVDIHGFSIRYMNLQMGQYVFQSYRNGLVDPAVALDLIRRNGYDTTRLIPKEIGQDIPIVAGIDGQGNFVYIIDTQNDHSFWGKDRIVIPPFRPGDFTPAQMDSLNALIERPLAEYDFFDGKKVREGEVAVRLLPYVNVPPERAEEMRGKIVFGIGTCEYRRGVFTVGDRKYVCALSNGFQSGVYGGRGDEEAFFPQRIAATSRRHRASGTIRATWWI